MQETIKVSVIIPVYNSEGYLRQCLDSIIGQTLLDIEIICIDDGSTDDSVKILKEYEKKDYRIIVLNQKNLGAGAARNKGMAIARGNYLCFLDSDDFFEPDMLSEAYKKSLVTDADVVVYGADNFDNLSKKFIPADWMIKKHLLPDNDVFSAKDVQKDFFSIFIWWPWDKLFKREFVIAHGIKFQEQRTTNDLLFVCAATLKAEKIAVIDNVFAHQRVNLKNSLSVTREKSWQCFYYALIELKKEMIKMGVFAYFERDFINYALNFSLWNLNTIFGKSFEKLYNKLRDEWFEELGITLHSEDYFYRPEEYCQFINIIEKDAAEFLSEKVVELKRDIEERNSCIEKCNEEIMNLRIQSYAATPSYFSSAGSKIRGGIRCYKEHGLQYTYHRFIEKINNRLR